MSSTNRSNARDLHRSDYYVTPVGDIELFLREFNKVEPLNWTSLKILDPCAGGNERKSDGKNIIECYHDMSYPTALNNVFGKCNIDTYDIRDDSLAEHKEDYLNSVLDYQPDIIITNPPFNIALSVIEKALSDVKDEGYVIMLLRLNYFGSEDRFPFFKKTMPKYTFIHHRRISFCDKKKDSCIVFGKDGLPQKGSTDSIEYCHMVFQKGYTDNYAKAMVI